MKLDLRARCARPACHKLIRKGKQALANFQRYVPYCSYHCREWHNLDRANDWIKTTRVIL